MLPLAKYICLIICTDCNKTLPHRLCLFVQFSQQPFDFLHDWGNLSETVTESWIFDLFYLNSGHDTSAALSKTSSPHFGLYFRRYHRNVVKTGNTVCAFIFSNWQVPLIKNVYEILANGCHLPVRLFTFINCQTDQNQDNGKFHGRATQDRKRWQFWYISACLGSDLLIPSAFQNYIS